MITTTHIVTNGWLARRFPGRFASPLAFVVGGFAPDIGLLLMTAGAAVFFPLTQDMSVSESLTYAFDTLFFESRPWIAAANVLHSPVVVACLYLLATQTRRSSTPAAWQRRLASFAAGCALHIAVDIPVHHDDGPVVFWPLDWSYRLESPVSYWDPNHFGAIVAPIDLALTVIGGTTLAVSLWRRRQG